MLHEELIPQFKNPENHKADPYNISCGLYGFAMGLGKKVLIADMLGPLVDRSIINLEDRSLINILVIMLCYTLQLYFDFSGYSDMALGLGRMFNFRLPVNFRSPFKSASVREHWQCWHITMGRFFSKYVYIPLGGNRKGKPRAYLNNLITFTLSGLWHGAAWTFVLWGFLNGVFVCFDRFVLELKKKWKTMNSTKSNSEKSNSTKSNVDNKLDNSSLNTSESLHNIVDLNNKKLNIANLNANNKPDNGSLKADTNLHNTANQNNVAIENNFISKILKPFRVMLTFSITVVLLWLFRENSITDWCFTLLGILHPKAGPMWDAVTEMFKDHMEISLLSRFGFNPLFTAYPALPLYLFLLFCLAIVFFAKSTSEKMEAFSGKKRELIGTALLLFWSIVSLSSISQFLYFDF
ncbi:MAG: MBOAT family protein [Lachnospiraceae bacterium]|nr:MBOAT family protein [Lachnospiraceae bacterium]